MIFNITVQTFGGPMRMGDMIACANVVEHFRKVENLQSIQFYLRQDAYHQNDYVKEFKAWLTTNTDYFSKDPGDITLPWQRVNLWDYRDISGDLVHISNPYKKEKKVVVVPIFDAEYNQYRNWTADVFQRIIDYCNTNYIHEEKVIVSKNKIDVPGFRHSSNLTESLKEIMTSQVYFGGDTGLSHFVGALENGPEPYYYCSSRSLLHTTPMYWYTHNKGHMKTYWKDFERTVWQ